MGRDTGIVPLIEVFGVPPAAVPTRTKRAGGISGWIGCGPDSFAATVIRGQPCGGRGEKRRRSRESLWIEK